MPQLNELPSLEQYLSQPIDSDFLVCRGDVSQRLMTTATINPACHLLIGPKGGLDDKDLEHAQQAGGILVSLGPRILRTKTATTVALTLLQSISRDLTR